MTDVHDGRESRLEPLRDLPALDLDRGSPDVTGWEVEARDGTRLGIVRDVLVDPDHLEAVYLMVAAGGDVGGPDARDRDRDGVVIVPADSVRLPPIKIRYRSTTKAAWWAAGFAVLVLLLAWMLGAFQS